MKNYDFDMNKFDLYNPPNDLVENSYHYYSLLRKNNPIHKNPDGSFIVTSYDALVEIYRNNNLWSSDKKKEFKPKFGNSCVGRGFIFAVTVCLFEGRIKYFGRSCAPQAQGVETLARKHGSCGHRTSKVLFQVGTILPT